MWECGLARGGVCEEKRLVCGFLGRDGMMSLNFVITTRITLILNIPHHLWSGLAEWVMVGLVCEREWEGSGERIIFGGCFGTTLGANHCYQTSTRVPDRIDAVCKCCTIGGDQESKFERRVWLRDFFGGRFPPQIRR